MAASGIRIRIRRVRDGRIMYDSGLPVADASELIIDGDMAVAAGGDYPEQYVVEGIAEDIGSQANKTAVPNAGRQTILGIGLHR